MHNLSFEEYEKQVESEKSRAPSVLGNGVAEEDDLGVGDEEETKELLALDPKEWKVRLL